MLDVGKQLWVRLQGSVISLLEISELLNGQVTVDVCSMRDSGDEVAGIVFVPITAMMRRGIRGQICLSVRFELCKPVLIRLSFTKALKQVL